MNDLIVIDICVVKLVGVGADVFSTWLNSVLTTYHLWTHGIFKTEGM